MRIGKKISQIFVVICTLLFLGTAAFITTFEEDETVSYFENRNLAEPPEWSEEAVLSGQWGKDNEIYLADHVAWRYHLLSLDTYIKMNILKQPLVKNVVVTDDYLLPNITKEMEDTSVIPQKIDAISKNIASVQALTNSYGGQFCYVAVPCQYAFHSDDYPWYMRNCSAYTAASRKAFAERMDQEAIPYIDMGNVFEKYDWDDALTSGVDNHSSIYGAYLTYREIINFLNNDMGNGLDLLDEGEFTVKELPNKYMGSRIKSIMGLWETDEKLSIIYPNQEIPYARRDYGKEVEPFIYKLPESDQVPVEYNMYMGGDYGITEIDTGRSNLPNVLIFGDSFTNAVECLLYTSFNKMWSIDLRYCPETTLEEYISTYQPDIVIGMRDYDALLETVQNGAGIKSFMDE